YSLINQKPCNHGFYIKTSSDQPSTDTSRLQIPAHSKLLLLYLAQKLQINIFLFSSHAKSLSYTNTTSKYSIGIFHNIDSFTSTSEYLIIALSEHNLLTQKIHLETKSSISPIYENQIPVAIFRKESMDSKGGKNTVIKRKQHSD